MIGFPARSALCWTIGILWGLHAQAGMAQIFARVTAAEAAAASNSACGLRSCPPKALTYGYYHENWRRWPEEPRGPAAGEMSPFAVPDRSVPAGKTPDARDEASQVPRQRKSVPATPEDADVPPPGKAPAAPSGTGASPQPGGATSPETRLPDPEALPPGGTKLPEPPSLPELPKPGPPEPQDTLPEVEPSQALPKTVPGQSDENFDLDSLDFQGTNSESMPPLTSAAALDQRPHAGTGVAPAAHLVAVPGADPAGDADVDPGAHRNPLRPKVKARYASSRNARHTPAADPAERASVPTGPRGQGRADGRANPLRRG